MKPKNLIIGCNGRGAQESSLDRPVSIGEPPLDDQFRMVKASGAFDFFDRLPLPTQLDDYQRAIEKHKLPVLTGSWSYQLGQDEDLLRSNLRIASQAGIKMHNIMIYTRHADGNVVTNDQVMDCYLDAYDEGMKHGVEPSFELHVNMWSEDYRRVTSVAEAVMKRGVPFNFTLDYSHAIFKINNTEELDVAGIREDVESSRLILDPFETGNLCDEWLSMGIVRWVQVRSVAPNGPRNVWSLFDPDLEVAAGPGCIGGMYKAGEPGRSILYPFTKPAPGEWHSPWHAYKLEPAKQVVRKVLHYHATNPSSRLTYITTEMINLPDYAHNARFSLIGQNAAIARFVRDTWVNTVGVGR